MKDRQVKWQVRKDKTSIRGGMKLMHQPRHRPPSIPQKQGVSSNRKRERQGQTHLSLTLDASGAGCRDYKSGTRQSPGSARRGRDVNPASRHSTRPKQEGSNIRPGEGECKESTRTERPPSAPQQQGVRATQSEEDRANATLCLSLDATGAAALTAGQAC